MMNPVLVSHAAIGIDAGGTQTRWCVMDSAQHIVAEGAVRGLSALMLNNAVGMQELTDSLGAIAANIATLQPVSHAANTSLHAGFTGVDGASAALHATIAHAFNLPAARVSVSGDVEIAFRAAFEPGEGYLIYAGTGSIAAHIDLNGVLHRAGGRGVLLDDAGGGYWIAREALRELWRGEDANPGAWRNSPLAAALFERIGGSDWAQSRDFFYRKSRGEIGLLAMVVAEMAELDPKALAILERAGFELARLCDCLSHRFGARPVALAGRAAQLHPAIAQSMRRAIASDTPLQISTQPAHHAAARMALLQQDASQ
ncbi:MAG: ATPase [Burkholderiales bacterium]|nr:MAG: ATPase [Betaproteobacteria bacterium]TAG25430.1 MAG: ATPase [Burkholderiales bacterium]